MWGHLAELLHSHIWSSWSLGNLSVSAWPSNNLLWLSQDRNQYHESLPPTYISTVNLSADWGSKEHHQEAPPITTWMPPHLQAFIQEFPLSCQSPFHIFVCLSCTHYSSLSRSVYTHLHRRTQLCLHSHTKNSWPPKHLNIWRIASCLSSNYRPTLIWEKQWIVLKRVNLSIQQIELDFGQNPNLKERVLFQVCFSFDPLPHPSGTK